MAIELVLLEDVADLGKIGDKVRVSNGYARNFLLPRKLALAGTAGVLKQVEAKKLQLQKEHEERLAVAQSMAAKIQSESVEIAVAVGENDQLFGSVNAQMLVDALQTKGIEIDKNSVQLDEVIRTLGETEVAVKLHAEVIATLKVRVVKKQA
ncbi:MAG: 50S ribosomal protein L9 [Oligosphaeraceae bacterium]|nr:50S ribosomal protein L9 [Oligosphaeraceae bacterium]